MTNLHQKIIDLITAPENRAEVGYVQMTMRDDNTWSIMIQTKLQTTTVPEPLTQEDIDAAKRTWNEPQRDGGLVEPVDATVTKSRSDD